MTQHGSSRFYFLFFLLCAHYSFSFAHVVGPLHVMNTCVRMNFFAELTVGRGGMASERTLNNFGLGGDDRFRRFLRFSGAYCFSLLTIKDTHVRLSIFLC